MSQPARRMNAELSGTISLLASAVLHGLLFLGLVRSASGAEQARDELAPARFAGNTFEIDTVDAAALGAGNAAAPAVPQVPSPPKAPPSPPEAPSPAKAPPSPPEAEAPSAEVHSPAAGEVSAGSPSPRPPTAPARVPSPAAPSAAPVLPALQQPAAFVPAASAPASAADSENEAARTGAPAGSSSAATGYGQDALAAATASFAKAFTRAVPRIASADRVWHALPLGSAGTAVFKIELDAQGKVVGQGTVLDEPPPAAHLARVIGRTVLLLRNQTFALTLEPGAPASQRFELSAEIRQVAALEDGFAEPEDLRQIGRLVEPTPVRPGKANFTYNSGRQVELTVRFLNP